MNGKFQGIVFFPSELLTIRGTKIYNNLVILKNTNVTK